MDDCLEVKNATVLAVARSDVVNPKDLHNISLLFHGSSVFCVMDQVDRWNTLLGQTECCRCA